MKSALPEVRKATFEDGPAIYACVKKLYDEAFIEHRFFAVDEKDASATIATAIEGEDAVALVALGPKGDLAALAIGVLCPSLFNYSFATASTIIFWVAPGYRKMGLGSKLAQGLADWGEEKGAGAFMLGNTKGCFDSAMGRLCKRLGLHPKEALYIKGLGAH